MIAKAETARRHFRPQEAPASADRSDHAELPGDDRQLQHDEDPIGERAALPFLESGQDVDRVEVLDELGNDTTDEQQGQQPQEAGMQQRAAGTPRRLALCGFGDRDRSRLAEGFVR